MDLITLKQDLLKEQRDLEADIERVVKDIEIFLSRNLPKIIRKALDDETDPAIALNQMLEQFKVAGLGGKLGDISEIYGKELRRIQEYYVANDFVTVEEFRALIDIDTIESLIRFRVEDIQNKATQAIGQLRPILLENIILGTMPEITTLAEDVTMALVNYTRTELNTALLGFSRMINLVQAESVKLNQFIYIGPNDKITRKFCKKVLTEKDPPIYTLKDIKDMNNDQGLPVAIYGGGYNCRHRWKAISDEFAKELKGESKNK